MLSFAIWLEKQGNAEPTIKVLQNFASTNADRWPVDSQSVEDYRTAITSTTSGPSRDDLLTALGRLYERWCNQERQTFLGQISEHWGSIALFIGSLIIAAGLAYGIFFNQSFFELMALSDHARGLITFLFSFATIAIVILVAVAVFWMDKSEVEARFAHAKDLISILVGVLGTVIGFYFGTASMCQSIPRASAIAVAPYTTASSTTTVNSANATFDEARAIITRK
jgi:nitrate reductase gamma subunit